MSQVVSNYVHTNDGVKLHYLESGSGAPLVLLHGWSQSAIQFKHQMAAFSTHYRVIALDMRGHGGSDKPAFGYRVARLAQDLHNVLEALNLEDVVLLGHSMGCSVIWNYWDLYGSQRIKKLVLVDQVACVTSNPAWSPAELEAAGAIFTPDALVGTANALAGADGIAVTNGFVTGMFTNTIAAEDLAWNIAQNLEMPRAHAATLLVNHCTQDWRDTIGRIDVPSLVVGGEVSIFSAKAVQWVGAQIKGAQTEIFSADDDGNHFMFYQAHQKFNHLVLDFL
jgi:non-heme chloroperoxidase